MGEHDYQPQLQLQQGFRKANYEVITHIKFRAVLYYTNKEKYEYSQKYNDKNKYVQKILILTIAEQEKALASKYRVHIENKIQKQT